MTDLGDISGFMLEGSLADLDWLDVNEKDYRDLEKLPKQNLDIAPDLQAVWSHEDKPAERFVPNKTAPKTMLDVGQGKTATAEIVESVRKAARYALMQSADLQAFQAALFSRFDKDTLREARSVLAETLGERGLLGKWYIDAEDFSGCSNGSKSASEFSRRYAGEAPFVLEKLACGGCTNAQEGRCSVFHKQIVPEVPYSDDLAMGLEAKKASQGRLIEASSLVPRERVRRAMLAEEFKTAALVAPKPVENTTRNLRPIQEAPKRVHLKMLSAQQADLVAAEQSWQPMTPEGKTASAKVAVSKKAFEVAAVLRREMLKGRSERDLVQALKLSFSAEDLQSTRAEWEPMFREAGYFGTIYSTQASFDDCHAGADFLAKHNSPVKGIVAGEKCNGCSYNKMGKCLLYTRPLVASAEELYTPETVQKVVREHRTAGRLDVGAEKVAWGETPEAALKNVYRVASANTNQGPAQPRMSIERAFVGSTHTYVTSSLTKTEIVKVASRFLNEGLYGRQLVEALKGRFENRDILASKEELRPILAEQGLQGIYYVDPTVYNDYGKGCNEAERLHRARLVDYVKIGSACGSCVHHHGGSCSKLGGKQLVEEPPYLDKAAQQKEILSSGEATEVRYEQLVNNGRSMLAEFQMQSTMTVDLDPVVSKGPDIDVEIGGAKVKL